MNDLAFNLAPRALHPLDGSDKCAGHCLHVELVWRETKAVKRIAWVILAACAAIFARDFIMSPRAHENIPMTHAGERLAPDRVDEPAR